MAASRGADTGRASAPDQVDYLLATPGTLATGRDGQDDRLVAETMEIVDQLQSDFKERDDLYEKIDAVIFGTDPISIPEAYRKTAIEVRSPLAPYITNTVTAALTVNPPSVQFQPTGFGDSYTENATGREHFFKASWQHQEWQAKRRLFRLGMWSLVAYGECCWKTLPATRSVWGEYDRKSKKLLREIDQDVGYKGWDQHAKDQYFDRKSDEFKLGLPYPIKSTDVDPKTLYYNKNEDGITLFAEVKEMPYLDAFAKFGVSLDSRGEVVPEAFGLPRPESTKVMGTMKSLKLVELWNWQECVYILQGPGQIGHGGGKGTLVRRFKHHYGNPYTRTLRGPYAHALGITTGSRLPHRAGLGILYGFLDLFPLLNSLLTIEAQNAYLRGFGSYKKKTPTGTVPGIPPPPNGYDGTEGEGPPTLTPGTIFPWDIEPVELPAGAELIYKMVQDVQAMLQKALPDVVTGVVSDQSGYALNQAAHLARLAWDPLVDNAAIAQAERVGFESWLIENRVREKVFVWGESPKSRKGVKAGWLSISPDDLAGVHRYTVRLDPETPSTRAIDVRVHGDMVAKGFETRAMAIEELGGNPDEVERGLILEAMKQDPAVQAKLREIVFEKLAVIDRKRYAAAVSPFAQNGVNPSPNDLMGAGIPQPGAQAPGAGMGPVGQVYSPGNGMPENPTPPGAVSGMGPGGGPGNPPGTPYQPVRLPPGHVPLPGQ